MRTVAELVFHKLKPVFVTLGLATSLSGVTLGAIFQGVLLPRGQGGLLPEVLRSEPWTPSLYYLAWFGLATLAAMILEDLGTALASYLASYGLGGVITYYVLALPGLTGNDPAFREQLVSASVNWTFNAFFLALYPVFLGLAGTIAGVAIDELLL